MKIDELRDAIKKTGGGENALAYAGALLEKINRLEPTKRYNALLKQLMASRQQGDFRGRVLEVNFADLLVKQGLDLRYGAKQGGKGDVDFCCPIGGREVFIEMKLLGQDQATRDSINQQIEAVGISSTLITKDTRDIARIQLDLFQKSSHTKFNPKPEKNWINLIAIDVSELQLGTAGGNTVAASFFDFSIVYDLILYQAALRPDVVGVFEQLEKPSPTQGQWKAGIHKVPQGAAHPRDYIHGALFLFRDPKETAALSYALRSAIVWNAAIVTEEIAKPVEDAISKAILPASG